MSSIAIHSIDPELGLLLTQEAKRENLEVLARFRSNGVWIAASSMEHGARLLSFDDHFAEIDGLLRC